MTWQKNLEEYIKTLIGCHEYLIKMGMDKVTFYMYKYVTEHSSGSTLKFMATVIYPRKKENFRVEAHGEYCKRLDRHLCSYVNETETSTKCVIKGVN